MPDGLIIIILAAALATSILVLVAVILSRKRVAGSAPQMLELVGKRLEQLEGLSRDVG